MKNKIIVVGGGASGLISAISAAKNSVDNEIIILEKKDRVGKKILATGNGRCNITNTNITLKNYYSNNMKFIKDVFDNCSYNNTVDFFNSIGLNFKIERDGRVYPYSYQASSVLDCLLNQIKFFGIKIMNYFDVDKITKYKKYYKIIDKDGRFINTDKIIIATGGCASCHFGSDGSGFNLLKNLGHRCTKVYPSLVQLKVASNFPKSQKGHRFDVLSYIRHKDKVLGKERGEVLFTDYGLSGIPIMNLSQYVEDYRDLYVDLDFLPDFDYENLENFIIDRINILLKFNLTMEDFFSGFISKKLGQGLTKISGIEKLSLRIEDLSNLQIKNLVLQLKKTSLKIKGTNGFKNAQVTKGGIVTKDFDSHTLESKICKNLYAAGELLDVVGFCGGYNLQWAWSTGIIAGYSATL